MVLYVIIMMASALGFGIVALCIYNGRTDLIHDYHQTKVTDKAAYGKAFGKSVGGIAVSMALSAAVALFGETAIWFSITVLTLGLLFGVIAVFFVQKKYNGGTF